MSNPREDEVRKRGRQEETGIRFPPIQERHKVSPEFIDSLAADGVSEGTIKAIKRDNDYGSSCRVREHMPNPDNWTVIRTVTLSEFADGTWAGNMTVHDPPPRFWGHGKDYRVDGLESGREVLDELYARAREDE